MNSKRVFSFLLIALSATSQLFAAPSAALSASFGVSANQVGIAAAVRGVVNISSQGQVGKIVNSGEPIYLGDEISTDEKGSLQILLLDETTFTIGANSAIVIDKFVYDPSNNEGEVKAKVVKGVFRFVTGKIGQKKPSQMEVDLPVGTIGIRGTIVAGETTGKKSMVALLGPGEKNNTQHRQGRFTLSGGGKESVVSKTGFGSTIDESGTPSNPFQVPEVDLERLTKSLGPVTPDAAPQAGAGGANGDGEGDGESPTEQSGQDTAMAGESAGAFGSLAALVQGLVGETNKASQNAVESSGQILDGITRAVDLSKVTTGQFHYHGTFPFQVDTGQSYSVFFNINFGSRTVGGGNSKVTGSSSQIDASDVFTFAIGSQPFPTSGNATFNYTFPQGSDTGGGIYPDANGTLTISLINSGGQVATSASHSFFVRDGAAGLTDTGSGNVPRESGLAP